ncbi:hypothetical protein QCA50_007691 [Cerrena zonata]|uniref:Uncharacterized protein n=1 Tax=Cerrena zonata TaxID=2478898 RepID=A0AAW0GCW7_9APHY
MLFYSNSLYHQIPKFYLSTTDRPFAQQDMNPVTGASNDTPKKKQVMQSFSGNTEFYVTLARVAPGVKGINTLEIILFRKNTILMIRTDEQPYVQTFTLDNQ